MYQVNEKERAEIILRLVVSLNQGQQGFNENRPNWAVTQYNELVKKGVLKEQSGLSKLK